MRTSSSTFKALLGATLLVATLVVGSSTASAQDNGDYTAQPPPVSAAPVTPGAPAAGDPSPAAGAVARPAPAGQPAPAAAPAPTTPSSVRDLPVTGADIVGFAAIGLVLLAAGALLLTVRRRATPA